MDAPMLAVPPAEPSVRPRPTRAPGGTADRVPALLARACRPGLLSQPAARALAAIIVPHTAAAGSLVLSRDQPAGSMWLVARGVVALGQQTAAGMTQHRSVDAGRWLDLASALLRGQYIEDAQAQTEALVYEFPLADVQRCAEDHPGLMQALAAALSVQVAGLVEDARALATKDVLARCATWLLGHAHLQQGDDGRRVGGLQLAQRKRTIAQQLGTTAETFSRSLRQLNRLGLIDVQGYSIVLRDADALQRLAEPPPARSGVRRATLT